MNVFCVISSSKKNAAKITHLREQVEKNTVCGFVGNTGLKNFLMKKNDCFKFL